MLRIRLKRNGRMVYRSHGDFEFSTSGRARQLVISAHGGWKKIAKIKSKVIGKQSGDGMVFVPANTKIYFYAKHTVSTLGNKVVSEVLANPGQAYTGLTGAQEVDMKGLIAQQIQFGKTEEKAKIQAEKVAEDQIKAALKVEEEATNQTEIHDYALYNCNDMPKVLAFFDQHKTGRIDTELLPNAVDVADVDMAIIKDVRESKLHFSDLFNAIASLNLNYEVIHAGFCRVNR